MNKYLITTVMVVFFLIIGIFILLEQYLNYGIWFQVSDLHHETFALASFAMSIGVLIGSLSKRT